MAEKTIEKLPTMEVKPFSNDFEFKDWELVEDVGPAAPEFKLELTRFLRDDETHVKGEIMLERAKEMGDLAGQRHAERILRQTESIPIEWRAYVLVFPGTVRLVPGGDRYVLCLCWVGGQWYSDWNWLGDVFDSGYRVVHLCK